MDLATDGALLYVSQILPGDLTVRVSLNGGAVQGTVTGTVAVMEDRLAVSPDRQVAVIAKTGLNVVVASLNYGPWVEIGKAFGQDPQCVAWVGGRFVVARIRKDGGALIETTLTGTVIRERPIAATSMGLLQYDEIAGDFILTQNRMNVAIGPYKMAKAVRRGDFWGGQVINPDRLMIIHKSGVPAWTAARQYERPSFVAYLDRLAINGPAVFAHDGRQISGPTPPTTQPPIPPQPTNPEPPPVAIPNHKDVVVAARAKYASLSGTERAYRIVNQVAWDLRAEGAGTFYKPSGTNYNDRSIDVVIYKNRSGDPAGKGATFDILGDAEGSAVPGWTRTSPSGYGDVKNWRAAEEPADTQEPPEPPPSTDYEAVLRDVRGDLELQAAALQTTLGKINAALGD